MTDNITCLLLPPYFQECTQYIWRVECQHLDSCDVIYWTMEIPVTVTLVHLSWSSWVVLMSPVHLSCIPCKQLSNMITSWATECARLTDYKYKTHCTFNLQCCVRLERVWVQLILHYFI